MLLHLLANEAAQIAPTEEQLRPYVRLVEQAQALFGARHYDHYDFIVVIDDLFGLRGGLEHHQSSENGVKRGYFLDGDRALATRALLPHEFTHSWNGKFRRPRDLWTVDYNAPMQDSLLWVYEGLTNYWGQVLAARSGLVGAESARSNIAWQAAGARQRSGRAWRNLQDTTNEPVIARAAGQKDWIDWQRGADYYDEGTLLWLAVDVKLRQLSHDRRSLDDFARAFFGVDEGRWRRNCTVSMTWSRRSTASCTSTGRPSCASASIPMRARACSTASRVRAGAWRFPTRRAITRAPSTSWPTQPA